MQRDAKLQGENSPIRCAPIRCLFSSRNPKKFSNLCIHHTWDNPRTTCGDLEIQPKQRINRGSFTGVEAVRPVPGEIKRQFFWLEKACKDRLQNPIGSKKKSRKFFQQCHNHHLAPGICEILGDVKLGNQHVRLEAMKSQGDLSHLVKHDITQDQPSICLCTASSSITLLGQPDFVQAQIWSWQRRSWNLRHLILSHICPTR